PMTAAILFAALLAAANQGQQSNSLPQAEGPSRELSEADVRAQVQAFLGSIDTPIRPEHWRALGPKAVPILEELASSRENLPTRRARALEGLSHLGSPRASKLMVQLAQADDEAPIVRMSAMRSAGRLLGPHRLVAALKPVLESA